MFAAGLQGAKETLKVEDSEFSWRIFSQLLFNPAQ